MSFSFFINIIFVSTAKLQFFIVRYLFIFIFFVFYYSASSQELFPLKLDEQNGLPSNVVYDLKQDAKGYIWMATNEGLYKYDGAQYKMYKAMFQTSFAGSNIQVDALGRTWYQNFDGFLYYVQNDELHQLKQNAPRDFVPYGITDKHLFVIQKEGVDVYDIQSLQLLKTIAVPLITPEHATVLNGCFYVMSDDILYKIDTHFHLSSSAYFQNKNFRVKYIYPFNKELYVVSKNNDEQLLYFFDAQLNYKRSFAIPDVSYVQGSTVINQQILLYSPHGVFAYDSLGRLAWNKKGLLPDYSISSVIKDYQDNYWISAINNGVFVVPDINQKLYAIPDGPTKIVKIKNGYWLGTKTGKLLQLDTDFNIQATSKGNPDHISVSYLHYDSLGDYSVMASRGFSFIVDNDIKEERNYNMALKQLARIDNKYAAYVISGACVLYRNPNFTGVSVWDSLYTQFENASIKNTSSIIQGERGKSVAYDATYNVLYFATNIGLYKVTPTSITIINKDNLPFYAYKIVWMNDRLYVLDTKGNLYVYSEDGQWQSMQDRLNLQPYQVLNIKQDGDQLLIMGKQFVTIFKPNSNLVLQTHMNFANQRIYDAVTTKDFLVLLTQEGILKMSMLNNKSKQFPRFYINQIWANQELVAHTDHLEFAHDHNNITIDFSLLEYAGNAVPLYYAINDKEWIRITDNTRLLEFPSLSPGQYSIKFKVDDTVSTQSVNFKINTAFWNAWWFYLLCALGIGAIIYVYFKKEARQMKRQIRLLNEKVVLEKNLSKSVMTSIKSQMNPHFFYNALNTIQAYIFANDRQNANNYLAKFSKLTRIILEMSEQETISLTEEVESLKLYLDLEKMRFQESFEYHIEIEKNIHKDSIELPPMLIQPYVENAIKHGLLHRQAHKILSIVFAQEDQYLKVIIDDNGIGRKKSEELNKIKNDKHQSFATKANEKRLEILNRTSKHKLSVKIIDKYDDRQQASGTRVELFIPLY